MPKYREVLSLQSLSLFAIGELIVRQASIIIRKINRRPNSQRNVVYLKRSLSRLELLLMSHVPHYLYDAVAAHILLTIKNLIIKTKRTYDLTDLTAATSAFFNEMNVIVGLTEIVLTANLRQLEFLAWPKMMRYMLYKNLHKLSGLEVLNLGASAGGWRTGDDTCLIDGIKVMKNLKNLCLCYDCNDGIIKALGDNCENLQILDITSSRSVTNRSMSYLLKCKQLIKIQLYRTSVTEVGFVRLIVGLPRLQDLGRCDDFGNIIKYIYKNSLVYGSLGLRKFQTRYLPSDSLQYLTTMCPKIEHIGLFHDAQITDLTMLSSFANLRELKLSSCAFYTNSIKQLLETRGSKIYSLHLEHVDEIDLTAIMLISQYCPLLNSFVLYNCDFVDRLRPNPTLKVKPYQYLEQLFWVADCSVDHLEFVLSYAINIKSIHLGSSTGITHSTIVDIFASNPMKNLEELRILYSSDMNVNTVRLLLENCKQLRVLSELESWQGISLDELKSLHEYLYTNNYNLDVRPTLSY